MRKVDKRCLETFQYHGLAQAKTAETMSLNPTLAQPALVVIPIQQAATTITYVQLVTSNNTLPSQCQPHLDSPNRVPKFCALCTSIGRQCPNNYLLPIHPEWSNSEEEEKDLNRQDKEERETQQEEDWDGTIQKQKEEKE